MIIVGQAPTSCGGAPRSRRRWPRWGDGPQAVKGLTPGGLDRWQLQAVYIKQIVVTLKLLLTGRQAGRQTDRQTDRQTQTISY